MSKIIVKPLQADPIKRSNLLQLFRDFCRRIVRVCLSPLWDEVSKG